MDTGVPSIDNGLTVPEAAQQLGVSEKTIRRRLKSGDLKGIPIPTAKGFEWRVTLTGAPQAVTDVSLALIEPKPSEDGQEDRQLDHELMLKAVSIFDGLHREKLSIIEELHRENMALAGRVGFLEAQLDERDQAPWWRKLLGYVPG